ncbi:MAG: hypothetical protein ABG776_01930 [Cyanobacteria bacterium J06555_13]
MVSQFISSSSFKNAAVPLLTNQDSLKAKFNKVQPLTQNPMPHVDLPFPNVIPFKADDSPSPAGLLPPEPTNLAQAQRQVQQLQQQVLLLTKKLEQANFQTKLAINLAKTRPTLQAKRPEPSTMSTTYIVPHRSRAQHIDRWMSAVPFGVMTVLFGAGLAAAVAIASPSLSLWLGLSPFLIALIRGLFVAIAFSTVISFFLELWQAKLA